MTAHDDTLDEGATPLPDEHFKPTLFVATLILLWASVYIILLSRGVTL